MHVDRESLRLLATAVTQDPTLRLEDGPPGGGWAIDPRAGVLYLDPDDLDRLSEAELHGLVCHEAAHATVTRYPWLVPAHLLREPGLGLLLNALEDCRIEAWMAARLPGTVPWIAAYNERLFPRESTLAGRPPHLQYALALVHSWWHGELPDGLDPAVEQALERTAAAREAVVALAPPVEAVSMPSRYRGSRVEAVFRRLGERAEPSGFEATVRLRAAEAWALIWEQIVPAYRELVELAPAEETVRAEVLTGLPTARFLGAPVTLSPERVPAAEGPVDDWEQARRDVLPRADALADRLERLLRERALPRWRGGWTHGQRVELRRAMQRTARPERLDLWLRKSVPERRDPVFLLALDLSGSMRGEGLRWALRGVALLAEALQRCGLPFELWGYQDRPFCLKARAEDLSTVRPRLAEIPLEVIGRRPRGRNRPEHNWDGPVLRQLVAHLEGLARTPVLLMVSDGEPSGPTGRAESALHEAVRSVPAHVRLVGIGLGEGAERVGTFYPRSVVCPLEDFPAVLAEVLEDALGRFAW